MSLPSNMVKITEHGSKRPTSNDTAVKDVSGTDGEGVWSVPEETPVAFVYNQRNYAVMMATPDDLVNYAIGFSISEQVVERADQIKSIDIQHSDKGVDFRIEIDRDRLERLDVIQRRRNMVGSASCGLCGLENADTLLKTLPTVSEEWLKLKSDAVVRAYSNLHKHQDLNARTHSVHGAGWSDLDGNILHSQEDVGRHNALDKLIGYLAQNDIDLNSGFVVMSSRCSYELVEKAAHFGIRAIVSISAPTSFALRKAQEANISLYARSPEGAVEFILDNDTRGAP